MTVTVVIPSLNSSTLTDTVRAVVESARRLPSGSVEVIVVDSSRNPPELPEKITEWVNLIVIRKVCGLLDARLEGIKRARGEWILNLDSDQVVHPGVLQSLLEQSSPAVIFSETPTSRSRWTCFVHQVRLRQEADFRAQPSIRIPCIPRGYRRIPLLRAVSRLNRDVSEAITKRLPTQHEDSVLFIYFLMENGLDVGNAVDFSPFPIYHPIPALEAVARKSFAYGRDFGLATRQVYRRVSPVDRGVWHGVSSVDLSVDRVWSARQGLNIRGIVYDTFRACFYAPGFVRGFFSTSDEPS